MRQVSDAIEVLKAKEASTSSSELVSLLEGLGFEVRRRKSGNHHTLDHPGIEGFTGANFDGGHEKTVKPCYTREMRKLLVKYEAELNEYLKGIK
jgi:predicted RNA binding protein YcfA (HicA-like mRNA interferase family)